MTHILTNILKISNEELNKNKICIDNLDINNNEYNMYKYLFIYENKNYKINDKIYFILYFTDNKYKYAIYEYNINFILIYCLRRKLSNNNIIIKYDNLIIKYDIIYNNHLFTKEIYTNIRIKKLINYKYYKEKIINRNYNIIKIKYINFNCNFIYILNFYYNFNNNKIYKYIYKYNNMYDIIINNILKYNLYKIYFKLF